MLPLATYAMETYKDDPCTVFGIKGVSDYHSLEQELGRKMHKAIAMIQFKLEGQLLRERREFHMEIAAFFTELIRKREALSCRTERNMRSGQSVSHH